MYIEHVAQCSERITTSGEAALGTIIISIWSFLRITRCQDSCEELKSWLEGHYHRYYHRNSYTVWELIKRFFKVIRKLVSCPCQRR